jgi:translocator protein
MALLADGGRAFLWASLGCLIIAGIGGSLTKIGPWYLSLKTPWWKPPNWAFPVVWTSVFAFIAVAIAIAWNSADTGAARRAVIIAVGVNAVLNMAWSWLFFTLQRPDWALIEVVAFWISIVTLMIVFATVSATAAALLIPYLVWVTVAAALNAKVVTLNQPFGTRSASRVT